MEKSVHGANDVMVPPASSSFVYSFDEEFARKSSPAKPKIVVKQKKESKSGWLVSGKKEEFDDSSLDATRTSKWAPEDTSTPIRPDHAKQSHSGKDERTLDRTAEEKHGERDSRGGAGEPLATQFISQTLEEKQKPKPTENESSVREQPPAPRSVLTDTRSAAEGQESSPPKEVASQNESPTKDKKKKKGLNLFKKK